MLNTAPLNARALNAPLPVLVNDENCEPIVKRLPGSVLNSSPLGSWALNGSGGTIVIDCEAPQEVLFQPEERTEVYLLNIGGSRVPMSSFQATMRRSGKSYLQAVVPNGSEYLEALTLGAVMQVELGYYYASADAFGELEVIAEAPLEQIRSDEGPTRYTLTLSGYSDPLASTPKERALTGVQTRSTSQGVRRVRSEIDLLLRPDNFAIDDDGYRFRIDQIQYFVNATSAAMEVIEVGNG